MSVDVARLPGLCHCGRHWYRYAEGRWYESTATGQVPCDVKPPCANDPIKPWPEDDGRHR